MESLFSDRRHQLARLFSICIALENRRSEARLTRRDLAQLCGCDVRTVGRDLDILRESGIAIEYCKRLRTFRLTEPLPFHSIELSIGETLALAASLDALRGREQTPWSHHADAISERLQQGLPPSLGEVFDKSRQSLSLDGRARRRYAGAPWRTLDHAIIEHQTLHMTYYSASRDAVSTRLFDPYRLVERNGYYNAVGWCHTRREVRLFSLDNIRALQPTSEHFQVAADFDLEAYLRGSLGVMRGELQTIVVRFYPPLSRWARRHLWPFPHQIEEDGEDRILVHGEVSGLEEIRTELLRWGASAEVLESPALRQSLRDEAQAIVARYESSTR